MPLELNADDILTITHTEHLVDEIRDCLNSDGFFCLENSISPEALRLMQNEVEDIIHAKGRRYFSLINPYKDTNSAFNLFDKSKNLKEIISVLAKSSTNKDFSRSEILNVLRIVTGKSSSRQALNFHYDATVVTVLIPIFIPTGPIKQCGHLLTFKNLRNIRRSALMNLVEKALIQNLICQKIIGLFVGRNLKDHIYELREGNIYFFWGYRTLHANLQVNPEYLRATMLFHFGDPHMDSFLINLIAKIRHWREKINSK